MKHESKPIVTQHIVSTSVGLKQKIPEEPSLLCFGTKSFEQFKFQSSYVPIPRLKVPPDLEPKRCQNGAEMELNHSNKMMQLQITLYRSPSIEK